MQAGQRVRIEWDGSEGVILELGTQTALLRMDEPDEDGVTEYRESLGELEVLQESVSSDFDGGFGIGGLGRYEETPSIPTVQQMQREDAWIAKLRRCRKCGQLEGDVMFSTCPDSGLCDDCFG